MEDTGESYKGDHGFDVCRVCLRSYIDVNLTSMLEIDQSKAEMFNKITSVDVKTQIIFLTNPIVDVLILCFRFPMTWALIQF